MPTLPLPDQSKSAVRGCFAGRARDCVCGLVRGEPPDSAPRSGYQADVQRLGADTANRNCPQTSTIAANSIIAAEALRFQL